MGAGGLDAATRGLSGIRTASSAVVALEVDRSLDLPERSGVLVATYEPVPFKAMTFTSRKWAHSAGGPAVVRASVGRYGETRDLQRSDAELVAAVLGELRQAVGPLPVVVGSRVVRWGGGLPQYAVGHLDRVRRIKASLPAGIAVAGAAYDGVGVPAVVRSGQEAARRVENGWHDSP